MKKLKMSLKDKIIIFIFILISAMILCSIWYRDEPIYKYNEILEKHLYQLNTISIKLDSLQRADDRLDTIINNKQTYYIYEQKIFMDSLIVSDDSVDRYISSYLKTWRY